MTNRTPVFEGSVVFICIYFYTSWVISVTIEGGRNVRKSERRLGLTWHAAVSLYDHISVCTVAFSTGNRSFLLWRPLHKKSGKRCRALHSLVLFVRFMEWRRNVMYVHAFVLRTVLDEIIEITTRFEMIIFNENQAARGFFFVPFSPFQNRRDVTKTRQTFLWNRRVRRPNFHWCSLLRSINNNYAFWDEGSQFIIILRAVKRLPAAEVCPTLFDFDSKQIKFTAFIHMCVLWKLNVMHVTISRNILLERK